MTNLVLDGERVETAVSEYIGRCEVILDHVFFAHDAVREFRVWARRRFKKGDVLVLLHDAPLDMVCRYLGKRPSQLSASELERATRVALENGWART